jgi:hypothetical protein
MAERRGACRVLVGISEGRRPLGNTRRIWEDDIKTDHQEICWEDVDWIDLAEDRDTWWAVVNTVMNLRVHKMRGIFWLSEELLVSKEGLCSVGLVEPAVRGT